MAAIALAVSLVVSVQTAWAAAPWFIVIHGAPLQEPILLDDWTENAALMSGVATRAHVEPRDLEGRPYMEVALFWGPEWQPAANDAVRAKALDPASANQHGRFYPASSAGPAIFTLNAGGSLGPGTPREVAPEALDILESRGVSIDLGTSQPSDGVSPPQLAAILGLVLAGSGLVVVALRR